jgi:plasmid stability protein
MTTMTLRDVPEELHAWLKQQAMAHHRSVNKEAIALLNELRQRNEPARTKATLAELEAISRRCAALPVLDDRSPDEILGYTDNPYGLPE